MITNSYGLDMPTVFAEMETCEREYDGGVDWDKILLYTAVIGIAACCVFGLSVCVAGKFVTDGTAGATILKGMGWAASACGVIGLASGAAYTVKNYAFRGGN